MEKKRKRNRRPAPKNDGGDVVDLSKKRRPTEQRRRAVSKEKSSAKKMVKKPVSKKPEEKKLSKGAIITLVLVGILVVAGGSYAAFTFFGSGDSSTEPTEIVNTNEVVEDVIPENQRRTDGVLVEDVNEANKFPVAVMIENLSTVRPQSGLGSANIVYETLAEGGITRFMAIMASGNLEEIKPVRSARPYYLEWVSEYDALYAHAGGSPEALQAIDGLGINDLDALTKGQYFFRGPGVAPHNLYTSTYLLELGLRDQDLLDEEPTFESWKFKDEEGGSASADGQKIEVDFSRVSYNAVFEYSEEENCYKRSHGDGNAHNEAITGEQLCPKNVVVQVVPPESSAGDKGRINLDVTGEGRAVVFRDGESIEGMWKKTDRLDRTRFYDENDEEIELVRGQVWISVVPETKRFEYTGSGSEASEE